MSQLLPDFFEIDEGDTLTLKQGKLSVVTPRSKLLHNFDSWWNGWENYVAVYCEIPANRVEISELLTYGRSVRKLYMAGGRWAEFDHAFRWERQFRICPWSAVVPELEDEYRANRQNQDSGTFKNNQPFRSEHSQTPRIPVGYCIRFHTPRTRCPDNEACRFKHACWRCSARHPTYQPCNSQNTNFQRGRTDTNNATPPPTTTPKPKPTPTIPKPANPGPSK